jgi:hypothetical protein
MVEIGKIIASAVFKWLKLAPTLIFGIHKMYVISNSAERKPFWRQELQQMATSLAG